MMDLYSLRCITQVFLSGDKYQTRRYGKTEDDYQGDLNLKLATQRLSLLQLAEAHGAEALQEDLVIRLHHYNCDQAHLGYRDLENRPIDTIS